MPPSTAGRDACRCIRLGAASARQDGGISWRGKGMNPSVVCEGRPGFFQNRRLREPPEIHRGHNVPLQLAERRGFFGPTVADGQF